MRLPVVAPCIRSRRADAADREREMQQHARIAAPHMTLGSATYVSPVHAVERVRIRARLRRARTDFMPLYVGAGIAGVACGFLLSILG
jgi:hypothetical protein